MVHDEHETGRHKAGEEHQHEKHAKDAAHKPAGKAEGPEGATDITNLEPVDHDAEAQKAAEEEAKEAEKEAKKAEAEAKKAEHK